MPNTPAPTATQDASIAVTGIRCRHHLHMEMIMYEEQMPWMMQAALEELRLAPKKIDDKKQEDPVVNREPRDVSWYHRGEECPH